MKRFIKLFLHYFKINLAREMGYRSNFFVWTLVNLGWLLVTLIFFDILYGHTNLVGGWNINQVLVLLGVHNLIQSVLYSAFYSNFGELIRMINKGQLDLILLKPVSSQFLASINRFNLNNSLSGLLFSPILIVTGLMRQGLSVSLGQVFIFIALLAGGVIVCYSLWFMIVCMTFYTDRLSNANHLFTHLIDFADKPGNIYYGLIGYFLWIFFPVVAIVTTPARVLLKIFSWNWILYIFVFAILSLWLSHKFWNFSLKRYSGASI
ncbi:MAG: ABC-2 family transporter protein [Candidatus Shapirobacteria bacterium]